MNMECNHQENQIQYEIQPIIINNQLIGINFYSRIPLDKSK